MTTVGSLVYQFFEHHLKAEKGLSQASIRGYRDGIRLFLLFLAKTTRRPISKLALSDLGAQNVREFLAYPWRIATTRARSSSPARFPWTAGMT